MKKVLILFGGNSNEHQISCISAKSILENIDYKKYEVKSVGINKKNEWYEFDDQLTYLENNNWLESSKIKKINNIIDYLYQFNVIFPIIHGKNGEDGNLQGMLDLFNFKYVGSKTLSSAVGMDKEFSKMIFNYLNIKQAPFVSFKYPNYNIKEIEKKINYPLIVKPANSGSSIGITKVNKHKDLIKAIKEASIHDNKIIVEKFIKGRELECAVIENKKIVTSTIGEIKVDDTNEFYDFEAKYVSKKSKTIIPASIPKNISKKIKEIAKKVFIGLGCKGFSRIDFFYDEANNEIYLNEINTIPGFTLISMFPKLLIYDKYSYKKIITILIENAYSSSK